MKGEDVLAGLRSDPATSHVPVVVLSADATLPTRELVLARGADGCLSKPFEANILLQVLDGALNKPRRPSSKEIERGENTYQSLM